MTTADTRWSRRTRPPRAAFGLRSRVLAGALAALVLLGLGADRAGAHTKLVRTAASARTVTLTFSTPVPARLTEINLLAAAGGQIDPGPVGNVAGDPASVTLPLRGRLPGGRYFVTWSTANDDGHVVRGVFDFKLGAVPARQRRAPAPPPPPGAPAATTAALSLARIAQDAALTLGFGLVIFLSFVWRRAALTGIGAAARSRITGRLQALLCAAAVTGAASAAAAVLLQSAVVGRALPWDVATITVLGDVVASRSGACWAVVAVLWLAILVMARRQPDGVVVAVAAALLIGTPPLRGHADDALAPTLVVHVAAVSAWLGGLVALLVVARADALRRRPATVAALVERFGAVALPCALAVFATGMVQAIAALDGPDQIATTGYGRLLAVKLALAIGVIALGARSRRSLVGRLRQHVGTDAAALMRVTIATELALAGLALAAAGILAGMAPPG